MSELDDIERDIQDHEGRIRALESLVWNFASREKGILGTLSAVEKFVLVGLAFASLVVSIVVLIDHLQS